MWTNLWCINLLDQSYNEFYEARKGEWLTTLNKSMVALQGLLLALEYQPSLVTTMGRFKTLQAASEVRTLLRTLRSGTSQEVQT